MLSHTVALVQIVHGSRMGELRMARHELGMEGGKEEGMGRRGLYFKNLGCPFKESG